ncbi:MAG: thymidine phosphorylase [Candidatus Saganbacteria bacterium]|nr:thymidine phosphorylase [Candidatus Saganbacteria bacterium]
MALNTVGLPVTSRPVSVRGILGAKKNGEALTQPHLDFLLSGCLDNSIPDYQAAAYLVAARCMGMAGQEPAISKKIIGSYDSSGFDLFSSVVWEGEQFVFGGVSSSGVMADKMAGRELSEEQISYFVAGVVDESISESEAAAILMAIRCMGMSDQETTFLTEQMTYSGDVLDLAAVKWFLGDKHSCGGVSDGTSYLIASLLSLFEIAPPMMSGRGLGHTGGTLDKLEAIPGIGGRPHLNVNLTQDQVIDQLNDIGLAIFSQTKDVAPADRKLYALRDVTETVDSIPLISSSIMSKKLAEDAEGLALNVTCGTGAFMKVIEKAKKLAESMKNIALLRGMKASYVLSRMDQPLAPWVGNALEIEQTLRILNGETEGFERFIEVAIELTAQVLIHAGRAADMKQALVMVKAKLNDPTRPAKKKFLQMVEAQGGDPRIGDDFSLLPHAEHKLVIPASKSGFVNAAEAENIGMASLVLGGGREVAGAKLDFAAGLEVRKFIGDRVRKGEPLVELHYNSPYAHRVNDAKDHIRQAYDIVPDPVDVPDQIINTVI